MRIGSEAPKRRTHSSNRHESQGTCRESATSNRHRYLITSVRTGPKLSGYPQRPPIIVPDAKRRRPVQRSATRTATERSVACVPRPRSWACEHRERSPCELDTTALRSSWFDLARPHPDGFERYSRDDNQRGARFRARLNRATTLYAVGPRTGTTMQSCASAAKLRSGGPIFPIGMKAKGLVGNPPPRTVIGIPSQAYERGRNCRGTLSVLQSLCRTQNDAVGYNALPYEPPQSDQ